MLQKNGEFVGDTSPNLVLILNACLGDLDFITTSSVFSSIKCRIYMLSVRSKIQSLWNV